MSAELPRPEAAAWRISGTYLEACNCEAICPCRRVGDRPGGRSTYGFCEGALSWAIEAGFAGDLRLDGLAAVLAFRYDDDEPGTPWDFVLYVDERGDGAQHAALRDIFSGARGGTSLQHMPWAAKPGRDLGVRVAAIDVEHHARRGWFRAGPYVEVRVGDPVATEDPVTCGIPGHHRTGTEHQADVLRVGDGPLAFALSGRCAYQSTFDYGGDAG